jgi:hypothetical protein
MRVTGSARLSLRWSRHKPCARGAIRPFERGNANGVCPCVASPRRRPPPFTVGVRGSRAAAGPLLAQSFALLDANTALKHAVLLAHRPDTGPAYAMPAQSTPDDGGAFGRARSRSNSATSPSASMAAVGSSSVDSLRRSLPRAPASHRAPASASRRAAPPPTGLVWWRLTADVGSWDQSVVTQLVEDQINQCTQQSCRDRIHRSWRGGGRAFLRTTHRCRA